LLGFLAVAGNHDRWDFELVGLSSDSRAWLSDLPLELTRPDMLCIHSDYEQSGGNVRFPYILTEEDARRAFARFPQRLIFFGHTHLSQIHELREDRVLFQPVRASWDFPLLADSRYLINVGAASDSVAVYDERLQTVGYRFF
jgi:hypothetical protein